MVQEVNGVLHDVQSFVLFFVRYPDVDRVDHEVLKLPRRHFVRRVEPCGEHYIIALCTVLKPPPVDENDLDGQWFLGDNTDTTTKSLILIVCTKSKSIIDRIDINTEEDMLFVGNGMTLGMAVGGKGIVITGKSIRTMLPTCNTSFDIATASSSGKQKKKKPTRTKQSGKKDGFARGMSLRG